MEYMLMKDGTVQVTDEIETFTEVKRHLETEGGVAYYWLNPSWGWRCIKPDTSKSDIQGVLEEKLPEMVKLAYMLQ